MPEYDLRTADVMEWADDYDGPPLDDAGSRIDVRHDYKAFLRAKITPGVRWDGDFAIFPDWTISSSSIAADVSQSAPHLHEYQRFATTFAVARRRAAIFAECGLGKTSIALAWVHHVAAGRPAVICAPLAALHEFINEREKFFPGAALQIVETGAFDAWLADPSGIALVTHHAFIEPRDLTGIDAFVLDESSILKSGDGRIALSLIESCKPIGYRLALSATPAPNDPTEYATHATWLGYMRSDGGGMMPQPPGRWYIAREGGRTAHLVLPQVPNRGHVRAACGKEMERGRMLPADNPRRPCKRCLAAVARAEGKGADG